MRRALRYAPLVLLCVAAVEVTVVVLLARVVGLPPTILAVLVASLAGLLLLRREGMRAWSGFRVAAQAGQPPGPQVVDGLVGLAAAGLLAVPGLLSGVLGALLVVPPGRAVARRVVRRAAERRVSAAVAGDLFGPRRVRVQRSTSDATGPGPVVQGEIVDAVDTRHG